MIKKDILAEDSTGYIHLQLFEDQVNQLVSGSSYKLTHMVLRSYNFRCYMHTFNQSVITKIPDINIKSVADTLLKKNKVVVKIPEFTQVRKVDIFKPCPACNKKFKLVKQDEKNVWCGCGSSIKHSRFAAVKSIFQAEVEFLIQEDEFMWASLFSSAMKLDTNLSTKDDVEKCLTNKEQMTLTVDMEKKLIINVV